MLSRIDFQRCCSCFGLRLCTTISIDNRSQIPSGPLGSRPFLTHTSSLQFCTNLAIPRARPCPSHMRYPMECRHILHTFTILNFGGRLNFYCWARFYGGNRLRSLIISLSTSYDPNIDIQIMSQRPEPCSSFALRIIPQKVMLFM